MAFWAVLAFVPGPDLVPLPYTECERHVSPGAIMIGVPRLCPREPEEGLYAFRRDLSGISLAEVSSSHSIFLMRMTVDNDWPMGTRFLASQVCAVAAQ